MGGGVGDALLDGAQNSARKHFTFTRQEEHSRDVQWPTTTLLTTVTDPQVSVTVDYRIPDILMSVVSSPGCEVGGLLTLW